MRKSAVIRLGLCLASLVNTWAWAAPAVQACTCIVGGKETCTGKCCVATNGGNCECFKSCS
jgi:hypothetical protein